MTDFNVDTGDSPDDKPVLPFRSLRKRILGIGNESEPIEHQVPTFWVPIIFLLGVLLFVGMFYNYKALPSPLLLKDEESNPGRFIAERARNYLKPLTNLGPKVVGSDANEVGAVNYLLMELHNIQLLNLNHSYHFLDVDKQVATGGFTIENHGSLYQGIQNVIAKFSPKTVASSNSILVNCHFDSVPISPGAADDGMNCAVMLEIIRVLATSNELLRHNIIFLFNGAEENGLQAAHAFITQHAWAHDVVALINLEAAGNGGKEIMFQAGPNNPWILQHYAQAAPHPQGHAIAEEIFQRGLLPSDTDFRIFRDFGNISGADFAHADNGYVYHTKFDDMKNIALGAYQHTGDNMLAYVKALANAIEVYDIEGNKEGAMVFFDFCGWFMISYSNIVGIILNCILSAFSLLTIGLSIRSMQTFNGVGAKDVVKEMCWSFLAQFLGWALAVGFVMLIGFVLDVAGRPLSWYTSTWLLSGVYYLPTFLGLAAPIVVLIVHKKSVLPLNHRVQMLCHANCVILIAIVLILTGLNIRAAYLPLVLIVLYETSTIVNVLTGLQNRVNSWIYVHIAGQVIPMMFTMTIALLVSNVLVPVSGRGGPASNPELQIAAVSTLMGLLISGFIIPMIGLVRSPRAVLFGFVSLIILFFIFVATPIGFPYGSDVNRPTPQRYWAFHSLRTLHHENGTIKSEDSGVFLLAMDRNSPGYITEYVPELSKSISTAEWCKTEMFCGIPFYSARMLKQANYSHWVPLAKPTVMDTDAPVILELVATLGISESIRRFHFSLTGPDHMGIYISPYSKAKLVTLDILENLSTTGPLWGDRDTYFVYYSYATDNSPLLFYIDIEAPGGWIGPRMDIAVTGHYMHHDEKRTLAFNEFLNSFPDWTHVTPWMSTFEGWKY